MLPLNCTTLPVDCTWSGGAPRWTAVGPLPGQDRALAATYNCYYYVIVLIVPETNSFCSFTFLVYHCAFHSPLHHLQCLCIFDHCKGHKLCFPQCHCLGYSVKLHPTVLHLLSSLRRSVRHSLAPLSYW